jgi:predicted permease
MPFAQSFLGPTGVIVTSLFDTGNAMITLGTALGVAKSVKEGSGFSVMRIVRALSKSVPFMTYIVMMALCLLHISPPGIVMSVTQTIAGGNAFLAMLMIGVGFKLEANREQLGQVLRIVGVRYVVAIALAALFYFCLPFALEVRQTLVILVFSPPGSVVPAFTGELGEDVGLSAAINSVSILLSIATIVGLLTVML